MRPMLRPGLHLLRRDFRTLQLGVEWPGVAVLRDTAAVRAVLEAVDGYRDATGVVRAVTDSGLPSAKAHEALEALVDSGALVDQSPCQPTTVDDTTWAALWLLSGPTSTAYDVLAARRRTRVAVEGAGRLAALVRDLLRQEQVAVTDDASEASLVVGAWDGEPSRDLADEQMRRGVPFLPTGLRELVGFVGPFVVPGRTACLRCVDLSRAEFDPCWPTLVESLRVTPVRAPSCPPSLAAVTAGYAAAEAALWASGARPVSWDAVVEIPHGLGEVQTVAFPPHPRCGCGWRAGPETMGA